jgi:hypothetical protein
MIQVLHHGQYLRLLVLLDVVMVQIMELLEQVLAQMAQMMLWRLL